MGRWDQEFCSAKMGIDLWINTVVWETVAHLSLYKRSDAFGTSLVHWKSIAWEGLGETMTPCFSPSQIVIRIAYRNTHTSGFQWDNHDAASS